MSDITIRPDDIGTPDVNIKVNVAGGMDGVGIEDITITGGAETDDDGPGGSGGGDAPSPEIPPALPNPHPLIFSGAVSAVYDGSEPVEVNIPTGGAGGGESTSDILTDEATGKVYRLYVSDGKLGMMEVEATAAAARSVADGIALTDETTGIQYKLHVSNGKLTMTEVE